MTTTTKSRREHDLLGDHDVPNEAYWGVQTQRAIENFRITGIQIAHYPQLIRALAMVKQACARANRAIGVLAEPLANAIEAASQEIIDGRLHDQFRVDVIQGGAGTSTNMNANEVIANCALEILGRPRGDYETLHPNNHVNMSQSTNDVYPTAIRLAIVMSLPPLQKAIQRLEAAFQRKSVEFKDVVKVGRTQLQDAVPMTLGQEFAAFAVTLSEDVDRLTEASSLLLEVNLGGTAIGTGLNAPERYRDLAVAALSDISGLPIKSAASLIEATSDTGAFVLFSGHLKRLAVKLSKICNDLRLLSSGPRAGLNEINLPPMQPGSSIMPGKINPVIPEVVNQVAFQVIGNDLAVTIAAEAGQLQLNAMEPLIAYNILSGIDMLRRAIDTLVERCVVGITANRERCSELFLGSISVITALVPDIGYETASRVARTALETGRSVSELVSAEKLLTPERLNDLMKRENLVEAHPTSLPR